MNFWKSFIIEEVVSLKSREKIIALLSQDNTLSAIALARRNPQSRGKTDCQVESGRDTPTNQAGQRRVLAGGRKSGLIFLEGAQFAACPFHAVFKKYPSYYRISEQHTDWLYNTDCMLFLLGLFLYRLFRQSLVSAAVGVHCTDVKGERFSG